MANKVEDTVSDVAKKASDIVETQVENV